MFKLLFFFFMSLVILGCDQNSSSLDNSSIQNTQAHKPAEYVGSSKCLSCHEREYHLWKNSHHDLAMQPASSETVAGDFNNTSFEYFGTISKFYKKDNQYYVQTDGPDGQLTEYPIAYTFGIYPLQQYLIKFPEGSYQALNIVWDTRTKEEGGQRWFHLYPDEHIKHDDELHWTGINQNWNFMCADCHSTNLQKNYDLTSDSYNTNWSEIDVACEACHGPASRHLDWADTKSNPDSNKGFVISFNERTSIQWSIDEKTGNAKRSKAKNTQHEINMCAQCHSRRLTIKPGAKPESDFLDHFQPALLTEGLYHADGQIDDEVYVYGSFIQSKMHHAGVTCSDCHEPHSLKVRAQGNALCAQCHLSEKYDSREHHLHTADSVGSQCVNCHMPAKNYMVIDERRDHSFRIPRPDLTMSLDVPNACNQCHTDKSAQWATTALEKKHGKPTKTHFAEALHAGRNQLPGADRLLTQLIVDESQPAIARATAVTLMPPYLSQQTAAVFQMAANDEKPLVGFGLAHSLSAIPEARRLPFAYPLLYDDMETTRALAAKSLVSTSLQQLPPDATTKLNKNLNSYKATQLFNADRPESLVNLASLYMQQGQHQLAEQHLKRAITRAPYFTPAHINLADHYRTTDKEDEADMALREALNSVRDKAPIEHALGLSLVRQKKMVEALNYLKLSAESTTTTGRYMYVYAIALHSTGNPEKAIKVLEKAHKPFPGNIDIIHALISINREIGNDEKAIYYEKKLFTH